MSPNIPGERYFEQSIEGELWRAPEAAPLLKDFGIFVQHILTTYQLKQECKDGRGRFSLNRTMGVTGIEPVTSRV